MTSTERVATERAWRLFIGNGARVQTILDDRLRSRAEAGMSLRDYHVLLLLSEAPGLRMRMRELSHRMVFSASRLTYQVDALCRRGWLTREPVPGDRRGSFAVLTEAGRHAFATAAEQHRADVEEIFFSTLTPDDVQALDTSMRHLSSRLNTITEETP